MVVRDADPSLASLMLCPIPVNPMLLSPGQLCWSNASLVSFISQNVRSFLRAQPDASIISVSQNDNRDYCQSSAEMAIIKAEGSPMGPLLRAVNAVAAGIADEFPHVAVDTLAYNAFDIISF